MEQILIFCSNLQYLFNIPSFHTLIGEMVHLGSIVIYPCVKRLKARRLTNGA